MSVSVTLADEWDRELWKMGRFYSRNFSRDTSDAGVLLTFDMDCTDPRLSPLGKYGFPEKGIRVKLKVPTKYTTTPSDTDHLECCVCDVKTTDADRPIPPDFASKFKSSFAKLFSNKPTLRIFDSLRSLDRDIAETWIAAILSTRNTLVSPEEEEEGEAVGRIVVSGPSIFQFLYLKVDVLCIKCERITPDIRIDLCDGYLRKELNCGTCERDLCISGSVDKVFGVDAAISRIDSAAAYVFCNCGMDCSYVGPLRPHKQAEVTYTCACQPIQFSFVLNSLVTLASQRKSTKHRTEVSSRKVYKEGVSLTLNGACKHFKKSFRWLLYPCCNEWFACNHCHDLRVSSHECDPDGVDKMMCGFCSKQQLVDNTCIECGKVTTPGWSAHEHVGNEPRVRRRKGR